MLLLFWFFFCIFCIIINIPLYNLTPNALNINLIHIPKNSLCNVITITATSSTDEEHFTPILL